MISDKDSDEFMRMMNNVYVQKARVGSLIGFIFFVVIGLFIFLGLMLFFSSRSFAHGEAGWIREGDFRSSEGMLCCGDNDCSIFPAEKVVTNANGYIIKSDWGIEMISYKDTKMSVDKNYWRCANPSYVSEDGKNQIPGKTKCWFAPRPEM